MRKILFFTTIILASIIAQMAIISCNDGETYAEMKEKEKKAINRFVDDNELVGKINVISESEFYAQDSTTDVSQNQFVRFNDSGIYMQIVRQGEGQTIDEMACERPDSSISKVILCRFMEYDIENSDSTYSNFFASAIVDKMLCTYKHLAKSYTATFTEGYMKSYYSSMVPAGWLKPLDFIRLTRYAGRQAYVRLIVPHSSGTSNAINYVLPYYYEISYELGK